MVNQLNNASPVPLAPPPDLGGGGGVSPSRQSGGLPIKLIAAVQMVYAKENEKQARLQGQTPLGLQPGWGGLNR